MGGLWGDVCDVWPSGSEKLATVWFAYTPDGRGEHLPARIRRCEHFDVGRYRKIAAISNIGSASSTNRRLAFVSGLRVKF
ncbi:hypothetical protein WI96_10940 [Burkholderia vietnamiensis]|nr:hypothetical protein WI96_10940 [Burkholderia vietnamiensis]